MSDKLIIANESALVSKYGNAGWQSISAALSNMVGRDAAGGLTTEIIYIDRADSMASVNGSPVPSPQDQPGAKAAVDAAYAALAPDYILLLDGPDVIPHIDLDMPVGMDDDDDADIPSDLPYACDCAYSRDTADFVAVTRVVGRLPAPEEEDDPTILVDLLEAGGSGSVYASNYSDPFAISADVWRESTELNVRTLFGAGPSVHLSPPDTHPGVDGDLGKGIHLINCHGDEASDEFYGEESDSGLILALTSSGIGPNVSPGTVVAVECCYGAQLYSYLSAGTAQPICMSYLRGGAFAYVGSTNIAYGPAIGNSQADLMVQFFLQQVLAGSSTGRAMLEARQKFVTAETMSDPVSLKTLAQFLLLGDPTVHPVQAPPSAAGGYATETGGGAVAATPAVAPAGARKLRRMALRAAGYARSLAITLPGAKVTPSPALEAALRELAERQGFAVDRLNVMAVGGGAIYELGAKATGQSRKVATMIKRTERERMIPSIEILVAHIVNERIARVERLASR